MTDQSLIEKYLPKDLWEVAATYIIADEFIKTMSDLIEMILRSRSIDTHEEKQNWFNLLPLMNDAQIEKLRAILVKEKRKLQEIEDKYEKKKTDIKNKYLSKRQEMGYVKKVESIQKEEKEHRTKEHEEADDLLASI